MQILTALAIAGTVTLAAPRGAQAEPAGPAIKHFTLSNGLEVVAIPDNRSPVVTHMIWYRVGSADEDLGKSGLAHFLEHLMFKGTAKIPPAIFRGRWRRSAGRRTPSPHPITPPISSG